MTACVFHQLKGTDLDIFTENALIIPCVKLHHILCKHVIRRGYLDGLLFLRKAILCPHLEWLSGSYSFRRGSVSRLRHNNEEEVEITNLRKATCFFWYRTKKTTLEKFLWSSKHDSDLYRGMSCAWS